MRPWLKKSAIVVGGLFALLVVIGIFFGDVEEDANSVDQDASADPTALAANPTAAPTAPSLPTPTPTPTGPVDSFGDGIHIVGIDILPGTYIVPNEDNRCFWSRLAGFSGQLDDVIANENPTGQSIVTIDTRDAGFESSRCGDWALLSDAAGEPANSFGSGTFAVGHHIQPGRYRTDGTDRCFWTRMSGFGGTLDDIIANGRQQAQAVVEIAPTDVGFESARCGTWVKIGD